MSTHSVTVEWRPIETAPLNRAILICDAQDRRVHHGTIILELDIDPSSERRAVAPKYPVAMKWWAHQMES